MIKTHSFIFFGSWYLSRYKPLKMMNREKKIFHLQHMEEGHIVTHVLVVLFGISAWIGVNGIFVQLPVLIQSAPETWKLPSYIVIVIQAANIGPVIYALLKHFHCKLRPSWWILGLLTSGTLSMGLLSFFYNAKIVINENEYSIILFILIFFNALVGCFSSILFMPYLEGYKKIYIVSYFIGEGLSGFIPSIVALFQGVNSQCTVTANNTLKSIGSEQRFSTGNYFQFICIMLFLSLLAFIILQYCPFVQSENDIFKRKSNIFQNTVKVIDYKLHSEFGVHASIRSKQEIEGDFEKDNATHKDTHASSQTHIDHSFSRTFTQYTLTLLTILCFFGNGFLPSIQSYSCLPYGSMAYQLSITLGLFANPLACFLALWIMPLSTKIVNYLSILCVILGSYVTYLAFMSPTPPLQDSKFGVILVVVSWTILIGFISYLKLLIVSIFRHTSMPKVLFRVGIVMQIGSASGAIVSFVLISCINVFKSYDPCTSPIK